MVYLDKIEERKEVEHLEMAENNAKEFVHLHTHTEFSLLDGMSKVSEITKYVKSLGMNALAITDHGSMFGVVKFSKECKKAGIKPIIGCEVYTAERTMYDKDVNYDRPIGHLVLLCKNDTGYKNLIKIVSRAYTEGYYYKPRTDLNELRNHHEGLICLSGCLAGKTQRLIVQGKYEEAKKEALELYDIFGEDFYLELQDHGQAEDKTSIEGLLRLHKETGIPLVATNDAHYIKKEDAKAHELLLCMQTKSTMDDPSHFQFNAPEYYVKSSEEMRRLFSYAPEACDNTIKIADKCNFDFEFGHYHIPSYEAPAPFKNAEEYFRHLCYKGLEEKYDEVSQELKDRLEYEISVIVKMGFVEYFLIVWDFINYAKTNGIPVGPGRGSAAGSVVAYCLSITEIDPIKYNLFFERFLNPERVSMPDIDVDFCIDRRSEVIDYVTRKYGKDNVCQIATLGTMKAKAAVKDVARVLNVPFKEANALSKMIPDNMKLREALNEDPDLKGEYMRSPQSKAVLDYAMELEDIPRHSSTHAAGVVIAPEPVDNLVPLIKTEKGTATQYSMIEIEELGCLKMDFLGLRNLTVIQNTLNQIKKNHGVDIDLSKLTLNDPNVFEMISNGKTVGVFQLESKGITDFMKKLKPSCFEDIIAGVALYRPGPMDNIPEYIENKKHPENIKYNTPLLAPILDVTYGIIVYQEEVMQIVQSLAGYSFARADSVRRAMSKKKADVMAKEREYFINGKLDENGNVEIPGCVRNGVPKAAAEKIFDDMESFAQYAFNKSHATAYAVITYQTAWLKCYYPSEFMAALMTSEQDKHDHLALFIKEAQKMLATNSKDRIKVLPPDINESKAGFIADKNGNIRYGLAAIKGVGETVAEIVSNTQINDVYDLFAIPEVNSKAIEAFACSGALKNISYSVASVLAGYPEALKVARKNRRNQAQVSLFDIGAYDEYRPSLDEVEEFPKDTLLSYEKQYLGTYLTGHPLEKYKEFIRNNTDFTASNIVENQRGVIAGMITEVKQHFTKRGEKMAFITIDDIDDLSCDVVIFPKSYISFKDILTEGNIIVIEGKCSDDSFIADKIFDIEPYIELKKVTTKKKGKELRVRCSYDEFRKVQLMLNKYNEGDVLIRWFNLDGKSRLLTRKTSYDNLLLMEIQELVGEENAKYIF